jgi:hypothetical protein
MEQRWIKRRKDQLHVEVVIFSRPVCNALPKTSYGQFIAHLELLQSKRHFPTSSSCSSSPRKRATQSNVIVHTIARLRNIARITSRSSLIVPQNRLVARVINSLVSAMSKHYIGIDVGTGSARACIINEEGEIVADASKDISLWKPKEGYYVRIYYSQI